MKKKLLLLHIFLMISCTLVFAQQVIKGKVTDNSGDGLPGVNVVLKGNTTGTSTDQNGDYSLSIPAATGENQTLVFSFIGYVKQEVSLSNRTVIDIKLVTDTQNLDEVVVVGYGTTAKKNLTTAISKVDPAKIPTSANNNVSELLFGRAAGLQVTQQSSQPGGNISVSIRGKGDPLLVIDGVVYPGSSMEPGNGSVEIQGINRGGLAGLNPNDIESIEFLKDASAAIYGVSAANGVMIITTKKGKAGRMSVSYDGSHSFSRNMPYLKPLNAQDYMLYYNQLSKDKYQSDRNMAPFGKVASDLSGHNQKYTDQQVQNAGAGTDWLGEVLRPGSVDNHNISVNGGTEKATYFFSGNYFNQVGSLKKSDLTRFSGRLNVSFVLSKIFRLNVNVNANRNKYSNPQAGWQTGGSGAQGFNALQAALAYPSSVPVYNADGTYSQFAITGNPVSLLDIKDKTKAHGLLANTSLDIDIIPNTLTAKLLYGNNSEYSVRDFYIPVTVFWDSFIRPGRRLLKRAVRTRLWRGLYPTKNPSETGLIWMS
jgi:TonB-linked SusC/RagA family outer membrane protein